MVKNPPCSPLHSVWLKIRRLTHCAIKMALANVYFITVHVYYCRLYKHDIDPWNRKTSPRQARGGGGGGGGRAE